MCAMFSYVRYVFNHVAAFAGLLIASVFPVKAQTWTQLPDYPSTKRDDGAAAILYNKAYFGTGLQEGWSATADWHALDLYSLEWTTVPSMPQETARQYAVAFPAAGGLYVFGGDNYGAKNDLYRFDPGTNEWSARATMPSKGLIGSACMVFGDKIFILGGKVHHDSVPTAAVWEYDAVHDGWSRKNDLPFGRRWRAAAASLGGLGYVAGGIDSADKKLDDFLEYDPGNDSWKKIGTLPVWPPPGYATLQPLTNKLVLFGGQDSAYKYSKALWYFRVAQQDWQQGPDLPGTARRGGMAVGWNEKMVYACGLGTGDQRLNETWMLDLPLGVNDQQGNVLQCWPNPFSDHLNVRTSQAIREARLMDIRGLTMASLKGETKVISFDTQALVPGVYVLELVLENGSAVHHKVVKQ